MTLGNLLNNDQEEQFGNILIFVRIRGRSGQVVTDRTEASLVSGPSQSDLLTLRADVVGRALVGITGLIARSDLDVGLLAGRSIGTSEAT